ncbi:MAG: exodeoxyribonuclease V subunit gamma [candidate division Zixibacteria bacterium]|nr:exodeoxyribonuclease V subunit gamma [candidate division Zixibacteria bacterium]
MPGLKLNLSNQLEILVDKLGEMIASNPLDSPMAEETIVVQSKGMQRWVSLELARKLGIFSNCRFPFPRAFVNVVFQEFIEDIPDEKPFTSNFMTWKIMKCLPELLDLPEFKSLKSYLDDDDDGLKLFQLSNRIADTFDQYLIFRPQMILGWAKPNTNHWQAILWRNIVGDKEISHQAAFRELFLKAARGKSHEIKNLPKRISVFGISALPPFYMEIFAELSALIEVNMFLMNPCREYWADIVSDREIDRITKKKQTLKADDLHLEEGNSLLASMGALGREFFSLVNDFDLEEYKHFIDTGRNNMLTAIQSDILNLRGCDKSDKTMIPENDCSIQIHSCHSPMREIEVLYDNLLAMFEADSNLTPTDILVMTPDIELYAPFIQTVFGKSSSAHKKIPFSIADRSFDKENPVIDTFLAILELTGGRYGAAKVLDLLDSPYVYRKFELDMEDIEYIHHWVKHTRICWGIDEHDRKRFGPSAYPENTWQAGIERLLLGYAMTGNDVRMFNDILPYDEIEGNKTSALGKFIEFTNQLFSYIGSLEKPKTLSGWAKILNLLIDKFILTDDDNEREMQVIRQTLNELIEFEKVSGYDNKISLDIIKSYLKSELEKESSAFGFIAGSVTFCAILPMRSIPFKVICIVGLNSDAFPRQVKPISFDLITQNPQPGDRSKRNDDRYLFLEAILSARQNLYLSYIGQSIEDNSVIPPSVVVSELQDYIENNCELPNRNILEHILTKHRLQAFNPEYFRGEGKLFCYSDENCQASRMLTGSRQTPDFFISNGLPEPDDEFRTIKIDQLCGFFNNPSRFILQKRLGIKLEQSGAILEEREPISINYLDKYNIKTELLKKQLAGENLSNTFKVVKARGALPHGVPGECSYNELTADVLSIVNKLDRYPHKDKLDPIDVDIDIDGFNIAGRIDDIYPDSLIQYRAAKVKAKDRLRIWIYHLLLNHLSLENYPCESIYIGSDIGFKYKPAADAESHLRKLLNIYWNGLVKPAVFFPESSFSCAEKLSKGESDGISITNAQKAWENSEYHKGESEDLYFRRCFGTEAPFDDEFMETALAIYQPLLDHQDKVKH